MVVKWNSNTRLRLQQFVVVPERLHSALVEANIMSTGPGGLCISVLVSFSQPTPYPLQLTLTTHPSASSL